MVLVADEKQFPPAVFLAARLAALRPVGGADIVLASDTERRLSEARGVAAGFDLVDVRALYGDIRFPVGQHLTKATYLRLLLPRLFEKTHDRILYIDSDTYPESPALFSVFGLDMGESAVGGARDLHVPFRRNPTNGAELVESMGIRPDQRLGAKYLNAGVLLIDIGKWRDQRLEKQALKLIREKGAALRLYDQTVLNTILKMRWLELSPSINMVTRAWASFIRRFAPPVIVHFTGPVKPWHRAFIDDHPVRDELRSFLKGSPWPGFIAEVNPPPSLLGGPLPPPPERQLPLWEGEFLDAVVRYLRETPFADVEQGITVLDPSALPPPAAVSPA